jgi:hypothetical protein
MAKAEAGIVYYHTNGKRYFFAFDPTEAPVSGIVDAKTGAQFVYNLIPQSLRLAYYRMSQLQQMLLNGENAAPVQRGGTWEFRHANEEKKEA